ncbi:MAG: DUF309 domain-containing protein [Phyllobacteriaceae bacterium]|nr:DUF309 domain-containing protein [Phyllobacteriaceae bacterium]
MRASVPLPPYAHVPGRNARHEEGRWDDVRATAEPGMGAEALAASPAFIAGMDFFENGFFWEAHEVWEAVWMACPPNSAEHRFVQALIQLANAELKLAMEKPKAATRLCAIAEALLSEAARGGHDQVLGVGVPWLEGAIGQCRHRAERLADSAI